ncbi:hypothetical protein B0H19DRAFT_281653 [Mycena capillaripes]|nr:hypothetical protein B0H19DRAFT_281653 [Mycena capillaripes]
MHEAVPSLSDLVCVLQSNPPNVHAYQCFCVLQALSRHSPRRSSPRRPSPSSRSKRWSRRALPCSIRAPAWGPMSGATVAEIDASPLPTSAITRRIAPPASVWEEGRRRGHGVRPGSHLHSGRPPRPPSRPRSCGAPEWHTAPLPPGGGSATRRRCGPRWILIHWGRRARGTRTHTPYRTNGDAPLPASSSVPHDQQVAGVLRVNVVPDGRSGRRWGDVVDKFVLASASSLSGALTCDAASVPRRLRFAGVGG